MPFNVSIRPICNFIFVIRKNVTLLVTARVTGIQDIEKDKQNDFHSARRRAVA